VAEAALLADHPAALLMHLQAHPEAAEAIVALPPRQWLFALARLDGSLASPTAKTPAAPASPAAASPSPITAALPPPPTVSGHGSATDLKSAALARGDFAEFDRHWMDEQLAKRR
jgi:hypothetical protein